MKFIFFFISVFFIIHSPGADLVPFANNRVSFEELKSNFSFKNESSGAKERFSIYLIHLDLKDKLNYNKLLKQRRIDLIRPLSEKIWVVRAKLSDIQKYDFIVSRGIAEVPGWAKKSQELPVASIFNRNQSVHLEVLLWSGLDKTEFSEKIKQLGGQVLDSEGRFFNVLVTLSLQEKISQWSEVEFVDLASEIDFFWYPFELSEAPDQESLKFELTGYETGTRLMGLETLWGRGYFGNGQIVGVADTGLDQGAQKLSSDFVSRVLGGISVGAGGRGWQDSMGHGTHVAGSVASEGVYSQGQIKGGAFGAELFIESMWSEILDNLSVPPRLSRLFAPAQDQGVSVHTNSWGSPVSLGAYNSMAVQADEWAWTHPEFLILFAAGNSGVDKNRDGVIDLGSIASPGTAKNVLTVGSSENLVAQGGIQKPISELRPAKENWPVNPISSSYLSDNEKGIAAFSSRGPTRDGRLKPELVAPGTNILSARSHHPKGQALWGEYDEHHVFSGGTSMSTPLVAGAAVLVREVLQKQGNLENPFSSLIKAFLMLSADDLFPGQYGKGRHQEILSRPDFNQGFGKVNLSRLLDLVTSNQYGMGDLELDGVYAHRSIFLKKGQSIEILMVYTDAPGTPLAEKALINDLDLRLVNSQGELLIESQSSINNWEHIKWLSDKEQWVSIEVVAQQLLMIQPGFRGQTFGYVFKIE